MFCYYIPLLYGLVLKSKIKPFYSLVLNKSKDHLNGLVLKFKTRPFYSLVLNKSKDYLNGLV